MALAYEAARGLFRQGEFVALIRESGRDIRELSQLEARHRILVSNALALTGSLDNAHALAGMNPQRTLPPDVESQAALTFGLVLWRRGNISAATSSLQKSVQKAEESGDSERIAWANLHLFRVLVEAYPPHIALTTLAATRRVLTRAGIPAATAYLHVCVAVLEGQTGRLDEAVRHCRIAASLLQLNPNAWVSGKVSLNLGCIACLRGEFETALEFLDDAKSTASISGSPIEACGAETTIGQVHLGSGRLQDAERTFRGVIADPRADVRNKLSALEGLARVHLAGGDVARCLDTLKSVSEYVLVDERIGMTYPVRWSYVTKARALLRQGAVADAITWIDRVDESTRTVSDAPFSGALRLVRAQALAHAGMTQSSLLELISAEQLDILRVRDLQPQYYRTAAMVLAQSDESLAQHCRLRANRIWDAQGIVSARLELGEDEDFRDPSRTHRGAESRKLPVDFSDLACAVNSLGAMFDLAHAPDLMAQEALSALQIFGCDGAYVIETNSAIEVTSVPGGLVIHLGARSGRQLALSCRIPEDPVKGAVLSDVFRLVRASIALEQGRHAEQARSALWPDHVIEEDTGALFLTEEMRGLLATARRIGPTAVPVLITGETGTGKEVLARTIHAHSTRASETFLPFNCSGVPKDVLDSQLFGHRRGSFTGATDHFRGVIRAANEGTLFLDEIGEAGLDVQPKLLRFLESNEVHPIGETHPVTVNVRIIAATNADLVSLIGQGRFREDLYYRLNVVHLHVPPLRERRAEIPALAHHFLKKHAHEYQKGALRMAEETMEYLLLYRWPGNVRQLANEMRRVAALAETDAVIMPEHLSPEIAASRRTVPACERALEPTELVVRLDQPLTAAVQHLERAMIQHALAMSGGRAEDTATMLGLSRKGLYLKRMRHRIRSPAAHPESHDLPVSGGGTIEPGQQARRAGGGGPAARRRTSHD